MRENFPEAECEMIEIDRCTTPGAPVDDGINDDLDGVAVRQQVDDLARVAHDLRLPPPIYPVTNRLPSVFHTLRFISLQAAPAFQPRK